MPNQAYQNPARKSILAVVLWLVSLCSVNTLALPGLLRQQKDACIEILGQGLRGKTTTKIPYAAPAVLSESPRFQILSNRKLPPNQFLKHGRGTGAANSVGGLLPTSPRSVAASLWQCTKCKAGADAFGIQRRMVAV